MLNFPPLTYFFWGITALIGYYFLGGFLWGAGYAPTSPKEIEKVAKLLDLKSDDTFYDLGSGYGRMIFAMAERYHAKSIGIEVDPIKSKWTSFMIRRKNLEGRVNVIQSNFLKVNLRDAGKVFIFLSRATDIMEKLQTKMWREMKPGSLVVSYTHQFKNWSPQKQEGELFVYSVPAPTHNYSLPGET
jgi:ubiquinone/menaquinone biosynthesis C-methylase UbiE